MDVKKITKLHAELLQGISIEDLSNKSLLKLGQILLKQFRGAKSVLRKLEPLQASQLGHWNLVKEFCSSNIDSVLIELEKRMNQVVSLEEDLSDDFNDQMLMALVDLVGSIRFAIFDEEQKDNNNIDEDNLEEVSLIFD